MYRIMNLTTGDEVGIVDEVFWIKVGSSGDYTPATEEEATGVAVDGEAYGLLGQDEIEGGGIVSVSKYNGGAQITLQQSILDTMLISMLEG